MSSAASKQLVHELSSKQALRSSVHEPSLSWSEWVSSAALETRN